MVNYPDDWEVKRLGECGKFISGNGFPLMYQGKHKGEYPFYKVSDLSNEGNENNMITANNYISCEVAKILSCNIIPSSSIIFAKIGAAIFLERKRITTCKCCIDNNMMSFQPFSNISTRFIYYVMQKLKFGDFVQTTALPSLSGKILGNILIPLPPLPEQTAIADTLAAFDTHITNLTALIDKKKAIREGALEELISGRTRLQGFSGEWRETTIGAVQKVNRGKRLVRKQLNDRGLYAVYQNSMKPLGYYEKYNCEPQSVFMIAAGSAGEIGFSQNAFWAADDCYYFKHSSKIFQKYLYYVLLHKQNYLRNQSKRTSIPRIAREIIDDLVIPLPPLDEQKAIADTLTALDTDITNIETERSKFIQIREGAMDDLLTGRIRLKV